MPVKPQAVVLAACSRFAELPHRVPASLAAKLEEVNKAKKLVRRVPTESIVTGWTEEAKKLPKIVEH
jgi:hypothetical protein